jgi:hypothetical protein
MSGEVSFIESRQFDLQTRPKFIAESPPALMATGGRAKSRKVRFEDKTRFVTFTGLVKPPGSASGAEALDINMATRKKHTPEQIVRCSPHPSMSDTR